MSIEEAKERIGELVMSRDAGFKMIRSVAQEHGPYRLLKVTKAGLAILEGREEHRIPTSLINPASESHSSPQSAPAESP